MCSQPGAATAADFNNDGLNDILVSCVSDVVIFPASGTPGAVTFTNGGSVYTSTVEYAWHLATADFDGDNFMDVAMTFNRDRVVVLKNRGVLGTPAFDVAMTDNADTNNVGHIRIYDVDGDGLLDIAVPVGYKFGSHTARWWRNTGGGTFDTSEIAIGSISLPWVRDFAMGDLDADGDLDAVVVGKFGVAVTYNLGAGTSWAPWLQFQGDNYPSGNGEGQNFGGAQMVDMDNDGDLDVIAYQITNHGLWMLENIAPNASAPVLASSLVQVIPTLGSPNWSSLLVDFDGDGMLNDIILSNWRGAMVSVIHNIGLNAAGAFSGSITTPIRNTAALLTADFVDVDSDGDSDLLVAGRDDDTIWWLESGRTANAVRTLDFDQDGDVDILVGAAGGEHATLFPNSGAGTFHSSMDVTLSSPPTKFDIDDVDRDGLLDITIIDEFQGIWILRGNDITSQVSPFESIKLADIAKPRLARVGGAAWGDVTGDGNLDLIWWDLDTKTVWLEHNVGQPFADFGTNYTAIGSSSYSNGFSEPWILDYDGDGDNDVVLRHSQGKRMLVWENSDGNGTLWSSQAVVQTLPNEPNFPVVFGDINGDGFALDFAVCYFKKFVEYCYWYEHNPAAAVWIQHPLLPDGTPSTSYGVLLMFNPDGDGSFDHTTRSTFIDFGSQLEPYAAHIADVNADGAADLVVTAGPSVFVYIQTISLGFQFGPQTLDVEPTVCGYNMACIVAAISASSACASSVTVRVPAGRYTGCFSARSGPYILDSMTLVLTASDGPGSVVFDCSADMVGEPTNGGVLFALSADIAATDVTLRGINVVGGSANVDAAANSLISVSGATASLTLESVSFTGVDVSNSIDGSRGAVLTVANGATASLISVSATHITGAIAGGFASITGKASSLAVVNSTFTHVSATTNGGVFFLDTTNGASLTVSNSVFTSNSASGAGGVAAINTVDSALSSPPASFDGCVFAANYARYGGLFAVRGLAFRRAMTATATSFLLSNPAALPLSASPSGAAGASASLALNNAHFAAGNHAEFGGAFFACDARIACGSYLAPGPAPAFTAGAGGILFSCAPGATAGFAPNTVAPWVEGSGAATLAATASSLATVSRYGLPAATAVASLTAAIAPPTTRMVGVALETGAVITRDAHGAVVVEPGSAITFTVTPDTQFSLAGSAPLTRGQSSLSFADIAVYAADASIFDISSLSASAQIVATVSGPSGLSVAFPITVEQCGPDYGLVSLDGNPLACDLCPSGEASTITSLDRCEPVVICPEGSIVIRQECVTCPAGSDRAPLSSPLYNNGTIDGVPPCICLADYYSPDGTIDSECIACPSGAVCAGGLAAPVSSVGHYQLASATLFESCVRPNACPGADTCAPGYTGVGCRKCAPGYYSTPDLECRFCPGVSWVMFSAFWFVLVVVVISWSIFLVCIDAALVSSLPTRSSGRPTLPRSRTSWAMMQSKHSLSHRSRVPFALSATIVFLQVVGIIGTSSQLKWPSSSKQIYQLLNLANFDTSYLAVECVLDDFVVRYTLKTMYPLVMALLFIPLAGLLKTPLACSIRLKAPLSAVLEKTVAVLGPMLYLSLSRASLVLFDCTRTPEGTYTYDEDPSVECFTGEWLTVLPIGIVALIVFTIGIPLYLGLRIYRVRHELSSPHALAIYGTLYDLYRHHYWYFEFSRLFQRLLIVVLALFLSQWPFWQIMGLSAVFGIYLVCQIKIEPYYDPMYNKMDATLSGIVLALLGLGFCFYAEEFPTDGVRYFFEIALWGVLAFALAALLHNLFLELKLKRAAQSKVSPTNLDSADTSASAALLLKHSREAHVWANTESHLLEMYAVDEASKARLATAVATFRHSIMTGAVFVDNSSPQQLSTAGSKASVGLASTELVDSGPLPPRPPADADASSSSSSDSSESPVTSPSAKSFPAFSSSASMSVSAAASPRLNKSAASRGSIASRRRINASEHPRSNASLAR
ncbi:uncharacterized protein AMSG_04254 [Thecamonas trahens ATCC 50062]|uniref:Tyrosine-protein kinase ephrin type A/B receptor-like domain-containing protein n=1 Tax=Thecamonas trahens ATCC 50062 TaxID=461836 RepID=A0A0L0D734_THETB|nr:hypothetical protein AMSG_04254 [Thecamonas trahens ATCC 50062]KNC48020.1 hypothetical protein AMSG_04254 [Thecamonas trahens ATCC 50062]|eukprot:XP_013759035.1 hypothetical protein AMSG_04254 [Thecamonas trahens ATCC 50062]